MLYFSAVLIYDPSVFLPPLPDRVQGDIISDEVLMTRSVTLAATALAALTFSLPAAALDAWDVLENWDKKTISVHPAKGVPEDLELLKAFNTVYDVPAISAYLKNAKKKPAGKGGSFKTLEIRGMNDCDEESCTVFARETDLGNSHALFFVIFGRVSDIVYTENMIAYDYDKKAGKLKPLPDLPALSHSSGLSTTGLDYQVYHFNDDNTLVITDGVTDGPLAEARSVFRPEGGTYKYEGAEITINAVYMKDALDALKPGLFAFYDVDHDVNTELFLKIPATGHTRVMSLPGNPETREAEFIDASKDGVPFRFYEHGLSQERSCGAECLSGSYTLVENSRAVSFLAVSEPGGKGDSGAASEYKVTSWDGRETQLALPEKNAFIAKLGQPEEAELNFQEVKTVNVRFPE